MYAIKQWTRLLWIALGVAGVSGLAQAQDDDATENYSLTIAPMVRYIDVDGNEALFESHYWMPDGWSGGIDDFIYERRTDDGRYIRVDGQAIAGEHDYELIIKMYDADGGLLEIGATNFRKYGDEAGWYTSAGPANGAYVRDEDLALDIGRAWIAWTLMATDNLALTIGYEYAYKKGSKYSTVYGETSTGGTKMIYPSYKDVREDAHTISLELDYTGDGLNVVNQLVYQKFEGDWTRIDVVPPGPNGQTYPTGHLYQEIYEHDQITYALAIDKWLNDWALLGLGYMYLWQEGELTLDMDTVELEVPGTSRSHSPYTVEPFDIDEYSHVGNLSLMLAPNAMVQVIASLEAEFGKKTMDGDYISVDTGGGGPPSTSTPSFTASDRLYQGLEESFELRLKVIPRSVLYARATFEQSRWEVQEHDEPGGWMRDTDTDRDSQKYRIGFNSRPMRGVSLNLYVQKTYKQDDYTHDIDPDGGGYSAFIQQQEYEAEEFGARLTLQHTNWLQTNYKYTLIHAETETQTELSTLSADSMDYDAHIVTVGFTLTPNDRVTLSSMVNYQQIRTALPAWYNPAVEDYQPETWLFVNNASFALGEATTLTLGYEYMVTDEDQDGTVFRSGYNYEQHAAKVGISHWFTDDIEGYISYAYYANQDFDRGSAGDYQAQAITTGVSLTF